MTQPTEADIRAAYREAGVSDRYKCADARPFILALARRIEAEREAVVVVEETQSSPDPECGVCGGEGEDSDPYGMFDYDCFRPCPSCYTHPPKETTT